MSRERVLVCPTAFKESLAAAEAAAALRAGTEAALPGADARVLPLSDGGPGLLDAVRAADRAAGRSAGEAGREPETRRPSVSDPLGRPVRGRVYRSVAGEAVVESADACGLRLLGEDERDPLSAHTRGVGELLREAAESGAERVVVGLGGSATCDGGTGSARAFGYRFLAGDGRDLPPGGGSLPDLDRVELGGTAPGEAAGQSDEPTGGGGSDEASGRGPLLPGRPDLVALADVSNPLLGPEGAARTFAPQKGADAEGVQRLEAGLRRLAEVVERPETPRAPGAGDPERLRTLPGTGAAGGLGYGLAAFLGARLELGTEWVLERVGFAEELGRADLVVTGEGAYDRTSAMGKVVGEVVRRARAREVPVVLVCGRIAGKLPEGVEGADGGGEWLDAGGLARLAEEAVGRAALG